MPANTPISIQPLAAAGAALQLMRSWATAMPGEVVSCVGCHEKRTDAVPNRGTIATSRPAREIEPWYGPVRGFSFNREVQPVLDEYCVACHDGSKQADGQVIPDLRRDQGRLIAFKNRGPAPKVIARDAGDDLFKKYGGIFEPAFVELRRHIRVGGFESDIRLLDPGEFHADTSPLIQMLMKGHHGVRLDAEAWDRLAVWIDLNAPAHGTWREAAGVDRTRKFHARRRELRSLYAGIDDDPEAYPPLPSPPVQPVRPEPLPPPPVRTVSCSGWPFDAAEAGRRQTAAGGRTRILDLGGGVTLDFVRIPAGEFVMGDAAGHPDEQPPARVAIAKPFWMGACEVTNAQYTRFDPAHDSRFEHKGSWIFSEKHLGWRLNHPRQPVVRVSQAEAQRFCRWLSERMGLAVTLPTEAQWEYACRAGTDTPLTYGGLDTDFSPFANLADVTIRNLAYDTDGRYTADLVPRDTRFDDRTLVTADVGSFKANPWSLHDMHGNVWEWTRTAYKPYPYVAGDGRNDPAEADRIVVRGGSWRDMPKRSRSAFRLNYPAWRRVFNVGFRVVVEGEMTRRAVARSAAVSAAERP